MNKSFICIIDDDPIYQLVTKKIIERSGYFPSVKSFFNGSEAYSYFSNSEALPQVILLDLEMPVMDGWEFLDKIKELNNLFHTKTEIYIVSSSIAQEDKERANAYKTIKGFISKPVDFSKIKTIAKGV